MLLELLVQTFFSITECTDIITSIVSFSPVHKDCSNETSPVTVLKEQRLLETILMVTEAGALLPHHKELSQLLL
jgi:hypothetical protein